MYYVLNFKNHTFASCDDDVAVDDFFKNEILAGVKDFNSYEIVNAFDDGCRMTFDEFFASGEISNIEELVDLTLSIDDLDSYEDSGNIIEISKQIIDDAFVNNILYIMFLENNFEDVYQYVVSEDLEESYICKLIQIIPREKFEKTIDL